MGPAQLGHTPKHRQHRLTCSDTTKLKIARKLPLAGMVGFDAVGSPALVPLIAEIYAGSEIKAALAGSTVFACRFVRLPRPRCPRVRVRRTRWR